MVLIFLDSFFPFYLYLHLLCVFVCVLFVSSFLWALLPEIKWLIDWLIDWIRAMCCWRCLAAAGLYTIGRVCLSVCPVCEELWTDLDINFRIEFDSLQDKDKWLIIIIIIIITFLSRLRSWLQKVTRIIMSGSCSVFILILSRNHFRTLLLIDTLADRVVT